MLFLSMTRFKNKDIKKEIGEKNFQNLQDLVCFCHVGVPLRIQYLMKHCSECLMCLFKVIIKYREIKGIKLVKSMLFKIEGCLILRQIYAWHCIVLY